MTMAATVLAPASTTTEYCRPAGRPGTLSGSIRKAPPAGRLTAWTTGVPPVNGVQVRVALVALTAWMKTGVFQPP